MVNIIFNVFSGIFLKSYYNKSLLLRRTALMEDEHQYNRHLDTHSTADKSPGRLPELELCDPSDDSSSSGSLEDFDSPDDPSPLSSDGCSRLET